jgi:hypothetical protein
VKKAKSLFLTSILIVMLVIVSSGEASGDPPPGRLVDVKDSVA